MALAVSSTFSLEKNVVSSSVLPDQAYVLSLVSLQSHYAAAASTPSNAIHIFDKSDIRRNVSTLTAHDIAITGLRSVDALGGTREVLLSCGKDGAVRAWDLRSGFVAVEMAISGKRRALLCCDATSDGMLVTAGTDLQGDDASILYWDPRNPAAPLRFHSSTHSDDVTAVHFSRSNSTQTILLSASSDGLISTSNPYEGDEDECGLHVGNWGCSVSQAGWITGSDNSSDGPRVWASSDMETLSTWSNELDMLQDIDRSHFTHPDPQLTWVTDYVIDCHSSNSGSFNVFVGSNEGDIAILRPSHPFRTNSQWSIEKTFSGKHGDVVRCVLWDEANSLLLSGGEDSKINVWPCSGMSGGSFAGNTGDAMDLDSPTSRKRTYMSRDDDDDNGLKKFRMV